MEVSKLIIRKSKMRSLFVGILLLYSVTASASFFHYNRYATQTPPEDTKKFNSGTMKEPKSGLVISGAIDTDKSTNYFGAFDFVFENKSDKWILLQNIKISFLLPEQNRNTSIPMGWKYSEWAQGMQNKTNYEKKRFDFFATVLTGAALAISFDKKNNLEGVAAATTLTSLSIIDFSTSTKYQEMVSNLPDYHVLKGDIRIPPGLFMKRWLLVNSTNHLETGYINTIVFEFTDQDGVNKKYYLEFRDPFKPSGGWQTEYQIDDSKADSMKYVE